MDEYEILKTKEYFGNILTEYWNQVHDFITQFGWYILGLTLAFLLTKPYLQDAFDKLQRKREEKAFDTKCKKDPTFLQNRNEGIEMARIRMQQDYDKQATLYAAKLKEKADKKREQQAQQHQEINRLGSSTDAKKKPWRPEYNPLMNNGGGTSYRPTKKRGCSGGGCG